MKRSTITAFLILFTAALFSQSTKEFFSLPSYEIVMIGLGETDAPDDNVSLYYHKDTVVCNKTVLKYNTSHSRNVFLNIEDSKVYVIDTCGTERLLFDFDIAVGDSIVVDRIKTVVVSTGDTTLMDNRVRKTYSTRTPPNTFPTSQKFIEGIGSEWSGVDYTRIEEGFGMAVICVSDADGMIYTYENINPHICELYSRNMTSSTEEDIFTNIKIFPNPATEVINIETVETLNYQVTIYDTNGKSISRSQNENQVNVTSFSSGIYLVEILDLDSSKSVIERIYVNTER